MKNEMRKLMEAVEPLFEHGLNWTVELRTASRSPMLVAKKEGLISVDDALDVVHSYALQSMEDQDPEDWPYSGADELRDLPNFGAVHVDKKEDANVYVYFPSTDYEILMFEPSWKDSPRLPGVKWPQ